MTIYRTKDGEPRTRVTFVLDELEALNMACTEYAEGDWPDSLDQRDALQRAASVIGASMHKLKRAHAQRIQQITSK